MQQTVYLTLRHLYEHCELNLELLDYFSIVFQKFSSKTMNSTLNELEKEMNLKCEPSEKERKQQLALMRNGMKSVQTIVGKL